VINIKQKVRGARMIRDDVEITPVMNLFLVLVPFLLLTAVFVRIAILELSLPSLNKENTAVSTDPPKAVVLNLLAIRSEGFELKSPGFEFGLIPKVNNEFDWPKLVSSLRQIREKYPDSHDVVVAPADNVKYEIVVKVMDRCRENGFANISISG
jgi:biopolymer transport protein ExbD